jgi:hypothetical protein
MRRKSAPPMAGGPSVDARDRVRRMTIIISGSVEGEEGSTTTDMTMDFLDFSVEAKLRSSAEAF